MPFTFIVMVIVTKLVLVVVSVIQFLVNTRRVQAILTLVVVSPVIGCVLRIVLLLILLLIAQVVSSVLCR